MVGALYLRYRDQSWGGFGGTHTSKLLLCWIKFSSLFCHRLITTSFHLNQYLTCPLVLSRNRMAQRFVWNVLDPHSIAATIFSVNPVWLEPRITCIFYGKQSFVISAFGVLFPLVILFNLHCLGLCLCRVCIYMYNREYIQEESKEEVPVCCFAALKSLQQCKPWLHPDCALCALSPALQW